MKHYRQCLLKKKNTYMVSWIPSEYAKTGRYIKLGTDDGWQVVAAWTTKEAAYIEKWHTHNHGGCCI